MYQAPEALNDERYTNKVDIWSTGLIFHQLLFCENYFKGPHRKMMNDICEKPYELSQE